MPASEQDFLDRLDRLFPRTGQGLLLGRGDDCAVLDALGPLCVSTDLFVEGAHFRRDYFSPADIGHKALAAAASDLAGMGAAPVAFALSLVLPEYLDEAFLDALLGGMAALSGRLGLPLAGGDLSRGPALILDLCVFGRPGPAGRLLRRGQAQAGDALVLLGQAGLARAGLLALEQSGREALPAWPAACAAHLRPEPLLAEGQLLAALPGVRGLMDLSDGLARDLPRLLGLGTGASRVLGADLECDETLPHPEALAFFRRRGEDPLAACVLGGEDYALIAAVAPAGLAEVLAAVPAARRIGTVSEAPGLRLNGQPFARAGFDHFGSPGAPAGGRHA